MDLSKALKIASSLKFYLLGFHYMDSLFPKSRWEVSHVFFPLPALPRN